MNPFQLIQLIEKVFQEGGTPTETETVLEYFQFECEEREYYMMCSLLIQLNKEHHPK